MHKFTREDLWSLEQYSQQRNRFRIHVMNHKKNRQVALCENARLYFEDKITIHYQIQEMLRIEKVFEAEGIQDELDAYNPLIPDGTNWKATFMLEYTDPAEREAKTRQLLGIETKVWVMAQGYDKVYAIADEDLERANEEKTSAVHFMRFELTHAMISALKRGATVTMGIDHPGMQVETEVSAAVLASLTNDLQEVAVN